MSTEMSPGIRVIDKFLKKQSENTGSEAEKTSQPQEKNMTVDVDKIFADFLAQNETPEELEDRRRRYTIDTFKSEIETLREETRRIRKELDSLRALRSAIETEFAEQMHEYDAAWQEKCNECNQILVARVFAASFDKLFDARIDSEIVPKLREAFSRVKADILNKIQPYALK